MGLLGEKKMILEFVETVIPFVLLALAAPLAIFAPLLAFR